MNWVACSRMYDVTPAVRGQWHALLRAAARDAGIALDCIDHAAPAPLETLWERGDLAAAFICGLPLAKNYPRLRPLVAPLTLLADTAAPTYCSVWLVCAASRFGDLEATFGQRIGWTVAHSHSGFSAPRQALLAQRTAARPRLYRESVGPLGHYRAALAALAADRIDVLAVDAYWWWLLQRHDASAAATFRTIGRTPDAPMPPLVCAPDFPDAGATRLAAALAALHRDPGARVHLDALGVTAFVPVLRTDYAMLAEMDRAAQAAGYATPA